MSLSFRRTMDHHALAAHRENPAKDGIVDDSTICIGSIQWHPEREPRFIPERCLQDGSTSAGVTLLELPAITEKLNEVCRK